MKHYISKFLSSFYWAALSIFVLMASQTEEAAAQTFGNGDVFVAVGNGQVQWRSPSGTLIRTLNTARGGFTTGMAFDKDDNLYVTCFSANAVISFDKNGVIRGPFGSGYSTPESIVFDENGNAYVGNLNAGIRKFSSTGASLGASYGGRVDFIDLAADQCTMLRTTESNFIARHNVCTNTALPNFASNLGGTAYALRIRENGEVLLANGANVLRLSATGNSIISTYDVGSENSWFALNLDPDGTSFWSANFNTSNVYKIDIATGNVLTTFNTGTGGSTVFGLAVFGELTVSKCASNVAPVFTAQSAACGSTIPASVGTQLKFKIEATDANADDDITLTSTALPTGAIMTPALPITADPVSSEFSWTPTAAQAGTHVITFNIVDECNSRKSCTITINVTSGNEYYSKSTGDLHNVLTWGKNLDGSGENPPDFTAGKTFNLANRPGTYIMTSNWTVGGTLFRPAGSQLQINGHSLSIASITGTGVFTGSQTSNLIIAGNTGGNIGNLSFSSGGGSLNNLTISRSGAGAAATIATQLNIYNVLNILNGTLNTGNLVVLKSNAASTARVAPILGIINGNVTVERYIPARRAWRLMNSPVGGNQTIFSAWQEGATTASAVPNPNPGFGTYITKGTVANGYDQNSNPLHTHSIQQYNNATDKWIPLTNTNATTVGTKPFMLFVRGDRSIRLFDDRVAPNNTVLRATGPLKTGDQTFTVAATGFTAIPNPFASPINYSTITRTNVPNNFYLWDPKMGGLYGKGAYVNVSFNGTSYDVTPASVSPESELIQSGQSFMVQSTGTTGTIVIKESDKSNTAATNVFRARPDNPQPVDNSQGLRVTLQISHPDNMVSTLDEVYVSYGANFSNKVDEIDAAKMENIDENIAIIQGGQKLMVERRSSINSGDVINLKTWNTGNKSYILEFNPINLLSTGLTAYLEDKYLKTSTPVSLKAMSKIPFTVTSNAASSSPDRFKIVFKTGNTIPVITSKKTILTAFPNPISENVINIQISNGAKGTYYVELVNSLGKVVMRKSIQHEGGTAVQNLQLNRKLAKGAYMLKITGKEVRTTIPMVSE